MRLVLGVSVSDKRGSRERPLIRIDASGARKTRRCAAWVQLSRIAAGAVLHTHSMGAGTGRANGAQDKAQRTKAKKISDTQFSSRH